MGGWRHVGCVQFVQFPDIVQDSAELARELVYVVFVKFETRQISDVPDFFGVIVGILIFL